MRRRTRLLAAAIAAMAATLILPLVVLAHPLGNFTVNHYSGIEVAGGEVRIHYVLDLAEIPAFQERQRMLGSRQYLDAKVAGLASNLTLTVDGARRQLRAADRRMQLLPGQGGLQTLRIEVLFTADAAGDGEHRADYRDGNDPGRLGWHEVTVRAAGGARVVQASAPSSSVTNELRAYPQDLLSSPLDVRQASLSFIPGSLLPRPAALGPLGASFGGAQDRFAALIAPEHVSWSFTAFAVVAAVALGAAHALSPGHGKAVIAGYMVGSRRSWRHALLLGATLTATHTAGVFALGLVTLYASSLITPERLYPWLTLISGLLVVAMGLWLMVIRWRAVRQRHDHGHAHHHHHPEAEARTGRRGVVLLGVSGGLLPCPSALIVLLAAISLHRVALGLLLIVAFSSGLALVLVGIGVALAHGPSLLQRLPRQRVLSATRAARLLSVGSAVIVCVAGAGLFAQALPSVR